MIDAKQLTRPAAPATYEGDFYAWTQEQAAQLRSARVDGLDWINVAEEIESLGRSDRREISSRLNLILVHLLKWQAQPSKRKAGWRSVREQRHKIAGVLDESPSLAGYPKRVLAPEYAAARAMAADETGLPETSFPRACPFKVEQVLGENFRPESA